MWRLKARLSYWLARKLFHWRWCVRQPRLWRWMEGQFARMANLGDTDAQSFYGHILAFRGQGLGAKEEGVRLLRQDLTACKNWPELDNILDNFLKNAVLQPME